MEDLITVIIPVYNVEKYISKCIESVLRQTYKNLEIIIVDDGSTDLSGSICDDYSQKYNNILVIHKENGGLSSARNRAIDVIHGNYLMFLDSDDWIEDCTIEYLLTLIKQYNADMSAVRFNPVYVNKLNTRSKDYSNSVHIYNTIEALETFLFNGYLSPCACGKLWKVKDWEGIRFPEGKLFEDQYTIYKVLERIETCVLSEKRLYNYLKRADSIGHSEFNSRTYDLYDAVNTECNYIIKSYPEIESSIIVANITWEIVFINMMLLSDAYDGMIIDKCRMKARTNIDKCFKCRFIPIKRKIQIFLFAFCFSLYKKLYNGYKVNHRYS